MKNANIASILRDIAFLLEMEEHDSNIVFKIRSYKRASDVTANLSSNIEEVYTTHGLKGLMEIPSIGKAIALKIENTLKQEKSNI
ncbi:MAG: helix-hairpin-helix domain-containing protein [Candidatus Nitrosopolaris sp.]